VIYFARQRRSPREPYRGPEETIPKKGKKAKEKLADNDGALPPRTKPDAKVRGYEAHVLVCRGGDCKKRGSKGVRAAFKSGLRAAGMNGDVRVDSVDCLGLCKHGPNAVVYPPGTWYLGLLEDRVPEVVERHLKGGEPVDRLAAEFRSPKRKRAKR
jgi:(2Fe-2S) ferredoxin